jgi:hypothetical protein
MLCDHGGQDPFRIRPSQMRPREGAKHGEAKPLTSRIHVHGAGPIDFASLAVHLEKKGETVFLV